MGYRQYIFIASSLRRIPFISRSIRKSFFVIHVFALAAIIFTSCKEPFDPQVRPDQKNYLVVEGFINAQGATNITLSRTAKLKDSSSVLWEQGAAITIMGEDNTTVPLFENTAGHYQSDSVSINKNQKYRILIKTVDGKEYLSAYVAVKPTPPIDSVSWKNENDGVHIYVSSHDPQNNTRYYKWDYEETWEIHSHYVNSVKYVNGSIVNRSVSEVNSLYYCWNTENSVSILLGSSVQLANDVISESPILFIPGESEKTSVRYSVLVKQYSLDREGYDFYKMVKNNTESLGSVFGPLPSEISGNINCINDPKEKVIGYITAATVSEKRIFISASDAHSAYKSNCGSVYVKNNPDTMKLYYESLGYEPYQPDPPGRGPFLGFFSSVPECVDCTTRGSSVKPSFW